MAKARTLVGLDVHATKIVAAVLDAETGELQIFAMSGEIREAAGLCAGLPRPVRVAYEAGPTGYGLARELARRGVECVVAAPTRSRARPAIASRPIAATPNMLVRLLLAGKLHPVRVPGRRGGGAARPGPRPGSGPDRSDARRHRLSSCCCVTASASTTGVRGPSVTATGWPRRAGLAGGAGDAARRAAARSTRSAPPRPARARDRRDAARLAVGSAGRPAALPARGRHAHRGRAVRRDRRLRALRPRRAADELPRPGACENTTGQQRRLGSITKTGSGHARRLLVEAAWHYRSRPAIGRRSPSAKPANPPRRSRSPGPRNAGCIAPGHGWKQRAKRRTIIAVAAARELAGFCWAITQIE